MTEAESNLTIVRSSFDDEALKQWWINAYRSDRLVRNTFFQSWEWNSTWHAHYIRDDARRELVLLRVSRGGNIVAAVPLFLQQRKAGPIRIWRYLLWIADRLSQYPDLITTETDTAPLWGAIIAFLHAEFPDAWLTLHDVLPESTASTISWDDGTLDPGESFLRIRLGGADEDAGLQRCAPHMQREIRRARRLLSGRQQVDWQALQAPERGLIEMLIERNRARFGAASWFADSVNTAFFRDLCSVLENELLLSVVSIERVPVHLMLSYLHGGTVHYVLSGMDDAAKRYSPGTMNLDATICWAMGQGFDWFDFLRGDEGYKREFAPEERTSVHLTIPAARGNARFSLARSMQRGKKAVDRS